MAKKPKLVYPTHSLPQPVNNFKPNLSDEQFNRKEQVKEFMSKIDEVTKRTPNGKS
ncbi:MAG TPA: hypothetical protein VFP97_13415 [Chitinophagaceae bacterium]|jgi:hypothetical protein|nr:hypothetical protein [Chitinophagaceae bacterium]